MKKIAAAAILVLLSGCAGKTPEGLDVSNLGGVRETVVQFSLGDERVQKITGPVKEITYDGQSSMASQRPFISDLAGRPGKAESEHFLAKVDGERGDAVISASLTRSGDDPWQVKELRVYSQEAWESYHIWMPPHPEQEAIDAAAVASVMELHPNTSKIRRLDYRVPPDYVMKAMSQVKPEDLMIQGLENVEITIEENADLPADIPDAVYRLPHVTSAPLPTKTELPTRFVQAVLAKRRHDTADVLLMVEHGEDPIQSFYSATFTRKNGEWKQVSASDNISAPEGWDGGDVRTVQLYPAE